MHHTHSRARRARGAINSHPDSPPSGVFLRPWAPRRVEPEWWAMTVAELRDWMEEHGVVFDGDRRVKANLVNAARMWWENE